MFKTIEKLRQKPEGTKKRFAFTFAFIFCLIIFAVWLSVVYPNLKQKQAKESEISKLNSNETSAFADTLYSSFSSIKDQISNIKEAVSVFSNPSSYYSSTSTLSTSTVSNSATNTTDLIDN